LFRLEDECRRHKEALHANSRRIVIDLDLVREGLGQATVSVAEFYERCRPLLEPSVATASRLAACGDIQSLYVTGGGSELPLVARVLREEFGRKVKRSEYTRSATAIGLAIQADATAGYQLRDVFTRNFGVWREDDSGRRLILDVIFQRGTRLPAAASRTYSPIHNIGHFRYLEAGQMLANGEPGGDITLWDEILFPFDSALYGAVRLAGIPVVHSNTPDGAVEELYSCDAAGGVKVAIRNLSSNYEREYRLCRWTGKTAAVRPTAKKRARKASL
jgi:molecular chaperone DnaK (HSP70)